MKTLLDSLQAELNEKSAEATALLDKKDRTGDETNRAIQLVKDCKSLKGRITEEATLRSDLAEVKSWADEPDRALPFSAAGGDGADLLGRKSAGANTLHMKNGRIEHIDEVGAGTLGDRTWDALHEKDYKRLFKKYIRQGDRYLMTAEAKDLQVGLDDQGGVFAPAEWMNRIIQRKPAPTALLNFVTRLTTGRQKVVMPRLQYAADDIYTSAFRVTKTGEMPASQTAAQVNDAGLTGTVTIDINTFMMSLPIGLDLMEDSGFPMDAFVGGKFSETALLYMEDRALNGTGASEPDGILNNAAAASANRPEVVLSGVAAGLGYDGLIDLQTALAPQYETDTTRFVFNKKSTYRALLKLKDSQNRPLFAEGVTSDGLVNRRARVLLGDEISLSQFAPNIGASAYPVVYGDLTGYYHFDRVGFSVQVLREVGYRANQAIMVGRFRFGGAVVEPWKLKLQKSNNS